MSPWETDERGDLILYPVVGFESAPLAQSSVFLQVRFARDDTQIASGAESIQFVLSPKVARVLATDLLRLADALERPPPPGTPKN